LIFNQLSAVPAHSASRWDTDDLPERRAGKVALKIQESLAAGIKEARQL
jgi:hypothetical protein